MRRGTAWIGVLLVSATAAALAEDWPRFRGPEGTGISREREVPLKWAAAENVRWKAPLPGPGMSSPIVWGGRVFLTQALDREGTQRALLCFDRHTGRLLWQRAVEHREKESTYDGEPHFCSATPATDGQRVVAFFASAGLLCTDMNGRVLWRKDLGRCEQIWGTASSPILHKDLVILNFGPGPRTFLIALDKRTGQERWRVAKPGTFGEKPSEWMGSWATPVAARIRGREELIMMWPDAVESHDPATGRTLWTCRGLGRLSYTSPLVTPEVVVAFSGFGGPALAVRTGGSGDVTETHRLWREEKSTQRIGSGVIVDGHAYIVNENGTAQCIDWKSGRTLWTERATGRTWSSIVHAAGRLYVTDQQGETTVLAAKPVLEVLARNPLGERTQASIAVSDGELFIRTYAHLWCIGGPKR